jgi:hypothetical protein
MSRRVLPRLIQDRAGKLFLGAGYRISDCERAWIPDADVGEQDRSDPNLIIQGQTERINQEFDAAAP